MKFTEYEKWVLSFLTKEDIEETIGESLICLFESNDKIFLNASEEGLMSDVSYSIANKIANKLKSV